MYIRVFDMILVNFLAVLKSDYIAFTSLQCEILLINATGAYLEPCKTSEMEFFAKTVNG